MKKILSIVIAFFAFMTINISYAGTTTTTNTTTVDVTSIQKRLNNIAYVLVKNNGLPSGISIKVIDNKEANAYSTINKEIYVYTGLLQYATTDEELAAVIAHEMGHIINGHCAKQTIVNSVISSVLGSVTADTTAKAVGVAATEQLSESKMSRKDEFEADLTAVDLLVAAKYNPLSLISVLNKITGNYIDLVSSHPSGEKRLMNAYDYMAYNYPSAIKNGYSTESYNNAMKIINLNLEERKLSTRLTKKYQKTQEKLKKEKIKRAKKMLKSSNGWDNSFMVLQMLSSDNTSSK